MTDFPSVGKVKTEQTEHTSPTAIGVRGKRHTDVTDDTDWSFHGCFFDSVFSLRGDADGF